MTDSPRGHLQPVPRRDREQADQAARADHALLERVVDGDETALAALYDRWAQRVHTIAAWILKDPDEAEDVVEETFWQIWRTAGQYNWRRAAASTWIAVIARSRALDRVRAQRRKSAWARSFSANAATLDGPWSPGADPATQERTELHAELADALRELPPEQRRLLELAYIGGLSHSEIAKSTSQPLGTVKTRIRLAMRSLRLRLAALSEENP